MNDLPSLKKHLNQESLMTILQYFSLFNESFCYIFSEKYILLQKFPKLHFL